MGHVFLPGEGKPIHSKCVDLLFHCQSARDAGYVLHLPMSCPLCSQSRGTSFLRIMSSASRSQPIYSWWMGLSGGGGFCCFLFFWRHLGDSIASLFFWRHISGDNFLGGRLPSFCLPFLLGLIGWLLHGALSFFCILCLVPFGSLCSSPLFPFHGYATNCGGGVSICT